MGVYEGARGRGHAARSGRRRIRLRERGRGVQIQRRGRAHRPPVCLDAPTSADQPPAPAERASTTWPAPKPPHSTAAPCARPTGAPPAQNNSEFFALFYVVIRAAPAHPSPEKTPPQKKSENRENPLENGRKPYPPLRFLRPPLEKLRPRLRFLRLHARAVATRLAAWADGPVVIPPYPYRSSMD